MKTTTLNRLTLVAAVASIGTIAHGRDWTPDAYDYQVNTIETYDNMYVHQHAAMVGAAGFLTTINAWLYGSRGSFTVNDGGFWNVDSAYVGVGPAGEPGAVSSIALFNGTINADVLLQLGDSQQAEVAFLVDQDVSNSHTAPCYLNAKEIDMRRGVINIQHTVVTVERLSVAALPNGAAPSIILSGTAQLVLQGGNSPSDVSFEALPGAKMRLVLDGSNAPFVQGTIGGSYTGDLDLVVSSSTTFALGTEIQIFNDFPVNLVPDIVVATGSGQEFLVQEKTWGQSRTTWLIAIPEPSTYALIGGLGAVALAVLGRRRRGGQVCA
ncbi:MAG: PEP-CTERM sorting domain-containing protein [Puniceicoccales bacterium]|jgi:hypothetical protein|nr:PEP-CTERM sorting domain-containing protein [Puniceicoccales bacterium]